MEICSKDKCVGCSACMSACPLQCIHMETNEEGFEYPYIDSGICSRCGKCMKACPIRQKEEIDTKKLTEIPSTYAAKNRDASIRKKSSSGGSFYLLAKEILDKRGKVVGAAFDSEYRVQHILVDSLEDIWRIMGSKYMQSTCKNVFPCIEECLKKDEWVLFSGTPCQIAGLKTFLGCDYEKLICVDIVCHGVPSPAAWDEYVASVGIDKGDIENVNFRDKCTGWKGYSFCIESQKEKRLLEHHDNNLFMKGFLADLYLRQSCYNCQYKGHHSLADITIGDFWGIHILCPEFDDDEGVSLLIVRSEKGKKILQNISKNLIVRKFEYEDAVRYNPSLEHSSDKWKDREIFYEGWQKEKFDELLNRVLSGGCL